MPRCPECHEWFAPSRGLESCPQCGVPLPPPVQIDVPKAERGAKRSPSSRPPPRQERHDVGSGKVGPLCDTCNKEIGELDGYLLSTKAVVLSVPCWKRYLFKAQVMAPGVLGDGKAFLELVALRASSDTPWHVCEECAGMFSFNRNLAKRELIKYSVTGGPSSGFGLCRVSRQGGDVIVDPSDEKAFNAAVAAALNALKQIADAGGSGKASVGEGVTGRKWWHFWK